MACTVAFATCTNAGQPVCVWYLQAAGHLLLTIVGVSHEFAQAERAVWLRYVLSFIKRGCTDACEAAAATQLVLKICQASSPPLW